MEGRGGRDALVFGNPQSVQPAGGGVDPLRINHDPQHTATATSRHSNLSQIFSLVTKVKVENRIIMH